MIREVDNRIAAIDLNGNHIIKDCKTMLIFLKEKLTELKVFVQSEPFESDTDEIAFFKQYKPRILGPLFYFHHILRIESQRPPGEEELDDYYEKQQEEQKEASMQKLKDIQKVINHNTVAEFGYNEPTNRITIKIKDKDTDEVIKEIPSEKALEMLAKAWELAGILVDEKR